MKKFLALLLVAAMLLGSLAACGQAEEEVFKVGAIYINSKNDTAGYTFAHHSGIVKAMKDLGLNPDTQLLIRDEVPEDKQKVGEAIDALVADGAKIIIGISFGYIDAMNEKAE